MQCSRSLESQGPESHLEISAPCALIEAKEIPMVRFLVAIRRRFLVNSIAASTDSDAQIDLDPVDFFS